MIADLLLSALPLAVPLLLVTVASVSLGLASIRGSACTMLLAFGLLGYAQIVGIGLLLSAIGQFDREGFLLGHVVFALGSIVFLRRVVSRDGWWVPSLPNFSPKSGVLATGFVAFLAVGGTLPYFIPSFVWDVQTYHLPRAYFWLQQGFVGSFPTGDFRMIEFPPNSAIASAWMMAFGGADTPWLHAPQLMAYGLLTIGTYSLARTLQCTRSAAAAAGFLMAMSPVAILQMGTAQNDLLAAFGFLALVIFSMRCLEKEFAVSDLCLAGIACGLALGTKFTIFFALPGLGVFLAILAARRLSRNTAARRLVALSVAYAIGFALLGSLIYATNWAEFGNPFGSAVSMQAHRPEAPGAHRALNNVLAYTFQTSNALAYVLQGGNLLAHLLGSSDLSGEIAAASLAPFESLSRSTSMPDAQFRRVMAEISGIVPKASASGLSFPSFLFLFAAPLLMALGWSKYRVGREERDLSAVGLLVVAISFVLVVASLLSWDNTKIRFFLLFQPLLLAGSVGVLSRRGNPSRLLLLSMLAIAAVEGGINLGLGHGGDRIRGVVDRYAESALVRSATLPSPSARDGQHVPVSSLIHKWPRSPARPGKSSIHHRMGGLLVPQLALIRAIASPGDRIGVSTGVNIPLYHLFGELPEYEFVPLRPNELSHQLDTGEISATLATRDRLPADWVAAWRDAQIVLRPFVNDRDLFVAVDRERWSNVDPVLIGLVDSGPGRAKVEERFVSTYTRTFGGQWAGSQGSLPIWLPTWFLPMDSSASLSVTIRFATPPAGNNMAARCEGLRLDVAQDESGMQIELPLRCVSQDPYQPGTRITLENAGGEDLRIVSIEIEQNGQ